MDLAYAAADLAICRGGAVTIAELAATATPAIIMPYPYHADMQQLHNAAAIVEAGAAIICKDRIEAAGNAALAKILRGLMEDDEKLARMRKSGAKLAKTGAAREVAAWLAERSD